MGSSEKLKIALDEWNEWDWELDLPSDLSQSQRSLVNQFIDSGIGKTGLEVNHTARDALFNARMLSDVDVGDCPIVCRSASGRT